MTGFLLPQHQDLIEGSAIAADVAKARGYWSAQRRAEVKLLGFKDAQALAPSLVIPIWSVRGERESYQIRPDQPRVGERGKLLKYETPGGSRLLVDVPPAARGKLRDPSVTLWITEGARKADSAVSRGLCCIALLGVWGFRGTNDDGGRTALPDWDEIALNDRKVLIAFDSDVMRKPEVHEALERLHGFLDRRGARVRFVLIPEPVPGTKVGLDDYFAQGGAVIELEENARAELPPAPKDDSAGPYVVNPATSIHWKTFDKHGELELVQLANFSAEIVSEVYEDDGEERHQCWEVRCVQAERETLEVVQLEDYRSCAWADKALGARARVFPGRDTRDRLADAVKAVSMKIVRRQDRYTHLGWRRIDGDWVYLSAGECIGPRGPIASVDVRLPFALRGYELPPPDGRRLREDLEASLWCWEVHANKSVAIPPWLLAFRAALGGEEVDSTLWLGGTTGFGKSEMAALAQQHWGANLARKKLPARWEDTANYLEALLFAAKDALVVIDEFVPSKLTARRAEELLAKADRIVRAQGNVAGRGRMSKDRSLEAPLPPRGALLVTGESLPEGHSLLARILAISTPAQVDWRALTAQQAAGADGAFARTMSAFLVWCAQRRDTLIGAAQRKRLVELRSELAQLGTHPRTPESIAQLALGWDLWKGWVLDCQLVSQKDLDLHERTVYKALRELGDAQAEHQVGADPLRTFLGLLRAALEASIVHVLGVDDQVPDGDARPWGWRSIKEGRVTHGDKLTKMFKGKGEGPDAEEPPLQLPPAWEPGGQRVGFVDLERGLIHLLPHVAFSTLSRIEPLPINEATLWRRMKERGALEQCETPQCAQHRITTPDGDRERVYTIGIATLLKGLPQQGTLRSV